MLGWLSEPPSLQIFATDLDRDAIDKALVKEIVAPDFPATDILIVGDHMPPYLYRKSRLQFSSEHVPWLLLKWRDK